MATLFNNYIKHLDKVKINISSIFILFSFIILVSNYISGVLKIGILDDLSYILIVLFSILLILKNGKLKIRGLFKFYSFYLVFVLLCFSFLYTSLQPFLYELYKISLFLIFSLVFWTISRKSIYYLEVTLSKMLYYILAINLFIIALQYIFTPYIILYIGFDVSQIEQSTKMGRWSGIFESVNALGDLAFLTYVMTTVLNNKYCKRLKWISIIAVIISTSKHAILCLIIYILVVNVFRKFEFKKTIIISFLVFCICLMGYYMNRTAIHSKVDQYSVLMEKLSSIDYQRVKTLHRSVEFRGVNIAKAIVLHKDYPFGTGLGTWGDFSSNFNKSENRFEQIEMSDSALAHLLVEQGIFLLFYLLLLFSGYFFVDASIKIHFIGLYLTSILILLVTMGFSSGVWPLLYSFIYSRMLISSKI